MVALTRLSSYLAHGKKTGADKAIGSTPQTPRHQDAADAATQQPKPRARGPSAATWPEIQRAAQQQARDQAHGTLQCGKSTPLQGCGTVAKQCARVVEKDMEKGVVIDTQTPVVIIL